MTWKISAVQPWDIQDNIFAATATIAGFMAQADQQGISFLCFPECFLQGYTLDKAETKARGLSLDSPQFLAILKQLSAYKTTVILGVIEEDNGAYFNTAVVIKQGKILGKYRKAHIFEPNFTPGTGYPVFTVDGLTFGINICYDARFPEGALEMASKGAKVLFYPLSNRWPIATSTKYRYKHVPNLTDRAIESKCWVVSSDITYRDDETIGYGCGAVISPEGSVIARVPELEVGMVSFEIEG